MTVKPCLSSSCRSQQRPPSAFGFRRLIVFAALASGTGCGGGPPALQAPDIDPQSAAGEAISAYDTDGDRSLSATELEACPGLEIMLKAYDSDQDGSISEAEIAERLQTFVKSGAALVPMSAKVKLNNRPLAGATVRFVPEDYFNGALRVATGTTTQSGSAQMAVAPEDLPENQRKFKAVQFGTYRVEITHPDVEIPAIYNTETTLGYETVFGRPTVEFRLNSSGKKLN